MPFTPEELAILPDLSKLGGTDSDREAYAREWLDSHYQLERWIATDSVPGDEPPELD